VIFLESVNLMSC